MAELSPFHGPNAAFVQELYERYCEEPSSVDPDSRAYFDKLPPEQLGYELHTASVSSPTTEQRGTVDGALTSEAVTRIVLGARVARMVREIGHLAARIDPLGTPPPGDSELELETHRITPQELMGLPAAVVGGPLAEGAQNALEAITRLRRVYSGTIGYEEDHIQESAERSWLRSAIESGRFFQGFTEDDQRDLLARLTEVETFERFLHRTFPTDKRFSIEGTDMLVPILDLIIEMAAEASTREVVIGMAHRGRLNVLAHILGKPYADILSEFKASHMEEDASSVADSGSRGWTGDVKYHLGFRMAYAREKQGKMPITLAPNPSHLEFVDPVVVGRARAAQESRNYPGPPVQDLKASLPIQIHGDAAFPGQGIVAETLNLQQLAGYRVGGSIHIIVNNQVGFTTEPGEGRSTLYASDLAKGFEIPIVHVNADDPEACLAAARMAHAYREEFGKDFLIDLVGYRRYGHNEGDEPSFTQPQMYRKIAAHPRVREIWAADLQRRGIVSKEQADSMVTAAQKELEEALEAATGEIRPPDLVAPSEFTPIMSRVRFGLDPDRLRRLNDSLLSRPAGFTVHATLERVLSRRREGLDKPGGIDWGHAESLALASILEDGVPIRLTGQDTERGTFGHRNAVLHDSVTGAEHCPLQALPMAKASFAIHNSPLSENAALGFEYGYSMHAVGALVLWEAQFGDFANAAQVIIDQFLSSGAAKWHQIPSLVLLLPHGYEGQGPEHSSARVERFLQLAAGDNIRVVIPTTAAQYFHVLRRQAALLETLPRPLIVMTPKSLLRHPRAASSLSDLTEGSFLTVIDDERARERPSDVRRVVLCSGKVWTDLAGSKEMEVPDAVALVRVEQLYPFPADEVRRILDAYRQAREVYWLQEEPRNMGGWTFVAPRIQGLMVGGMELGYIGREEAASPAEGSHSRHDAEQARILQAVIGELPAKQIERRREVIHAR